MSGKWRPFCLGLNVLIMRCSTKAAILRLSLEWLGAVCEHTFMFLASQHQRNDEEIDCLTDNVPHHVAWNVIRIN